MYDYVRPELARAGRLTEENARVQTTVPNEHSILWFVVDKDCGCYLVTKNGIVGCVCVRLVDLEALSIFFSKNNCP